MNEYSVNFLETSVWHNDTVYNDDHFKDSTSSISQVSVFWRYMGLSCISASRRLLISCSSRRCTFTDGCRVGMAMDPGWMYLLLAFTYRLFSIFSVTSSGLIWWNLTRCLFNSHLPFLNTFPHLEHLCRVVIGSWRSFQWRFNLE